MKDERTFCGLTHTEANKALAEFVAMRRVVHRCSTFYTETNSSGDIRWIYFGQAGDYRTGPFTHSLDSMIDIRRAMNREEQLAYMSALKGIIQDIETKENGCGGLYEMMAATPEQHVCAALTALGLGKRE